MGQIFSLLQKRYSRPKENTNLIRQMGISTKIDNLCTKYLKEVDDVFTFEVTGDDVAYAVIVIEEEPLINKFVINQISETLFQARLRRVSFWE